MSEVGWGDRAMGREGEFLFFSNRQLSIANRQLQIVNRQLSIPNRQSSIANRQSTIASPYVLPDPAVRSTGQYW